MSSPADAFGLQSLSDACLKVTASVDSPETEDAETKRMRLMEKANDLRVRIKALEEEEKLLRERAEKLASAD